MLYNSGNVGKSLVFIMFSGGIKMEDWAKTS